MCLQMHECVHENLFLKMTQPQRDFLQTQSTICHLTNTIKDAYTHRQKARAQPEKIATCSSSTCPL